jgi:hypothetical protein
MCDKAVESISALQGMPWTKRGDLSIIHEQIDQGRALGRRDLDGTRLEERARRLPGLEKPDSSELQLQFRQSLGRQGGR